MTQLLLNIDLSLVDWSRAQFALTAMYHWLFVPLTLGILFIIAIMETIYVKTNDPEWKRITRFWMKLFGINFAIGVATGLILEFEFGTNWSNYSWFVGDIFGAPLAIEGIMAFFMESTFIAIMFFGWNKVSKKFHLTATWLTAIGASLSALWILVANAWMQNPVGMQFNPITARNEMMNFWEVLFSPVAINKFLHTVFSGYTLGALFVIGISSFYLLKKREILLAKRSIIIASVFGMIGILMTIFTGHGSAVQVAKHQPMKLAAMEGLYEGGKEAELMAFAILNPKKTFDNEENPFLIKFGFKGMLSYLIDFNTQTYVAGINDLIHGNPEQNILSVADRKILGDSALNALLDYKKAVENDDEVLANNSLKIIDRNFSHFGYSYVQKPEDIIPHIPLVFYSFHLMVIFGSLFVLIFLIFGWLTIKNKIDNFKYSKLIYILGLLGIPMAYIASESGWIVAEVGRQPWVIQDLMTTSAAVTNISSASVQLTFWIFAFIFTILLIVEISIMSRFVKIGPEKPKNEGGK
ncbi:MAG: cytochrome ubiquinol oxidase subunit I [Bacteroidales bacterium]|jgi:cytochrome d ubiquinol oxidase subunit I|nr:cytochrome ubiquinol oxidase subunit I [Bacteroidales bacterium]MCK9499349.1 cytochrome ubiquinol oxidase subunit I [Bacteroidales bacterium]MDY0315755.1 cytochrome ubiquinol oxidase subunit I [Bacteroidales bacterium]NLB85524.1 cytochrome ubiquinol oxidase subunit I [Bacteroidales bacterium]